MAYDVAQAVLAERAESAVVRSLVGLMTPELAQGLGAEAADVAGGLGVRVAAAPGFGFLNRVLGVALDEPLSDAHVDAVLAFVGGSGAEAVACLQLPPFAETPEAVALLESRGFRRGGTWVKTMRAVGEPPPSSTDLRVVEVDPDAADEYGRVQCVGMEMPDALAPWCAAQVGAPGWHTFAAYDGDRMVAIGALFEHDGCGQLSGAATLPEARGRGGQTALLARRIERARELGLSWVTAETGSETPESPNASLHNMIRSGLVPLYDRRNWLADV